MLIQDYAPISNTEEAEVEWFYEDLQDLLELTPPKKCPFHFRGLECKIMGNTYRKAVLCAHHCFKHLLHADSLNV